MIVWFSDEAESDLEQIAEYIAKDNPRSALSFVQELRAKCERLVDAPKGFPLVPRYEEHGIRRRVHNNYLIFYRVSEDRIDVVHSLHGASDYSGMLFEN